MKNIYLLIMIMGFAAISACASDEVMETAESDASDKAEMMKQEQSAAMEKKKAAAAEAKAKADAKARADAAAKKAAMADEVVEQDDDYGDAAKASGDLVSTCEHAGKVRVIKVVYDNPETDTVCEVTYEKSTGVQTLWTAINDRDFCLDKATAFVEKQEGWGWSCSALE